MDYAIILGGGKGLRMGADVPKQFLPVGGMPILMRTIQRFRDAFPTKEELSIILVLPKDQQDYWRQLCEDYHFTEECAIADGGQTRFHSILNGLTLIPDDAEGVVAVHDGVRPFPSVEVIHRCFDTARRTGTAVPVIPVVETIRKLEDEGSYTVPRDEYRLVQTPQAFDIQLHKCAYRQPYDEHFTDDASVVEKLKRLKGEKVKGEKNEGELGITLVEGNRENIKITTPFDLKVAEALLLNA